MAQSHNPVPERAPPDRATAQMHGAHDGAVDRRRLASVVDDLPVGICLLAADGSLIAGNATYTSMTRLSVGERLTDAVATDDRSRVDAAFADLRSSPGATIDITIELAADDTRASHARLLARSVISGTTVQFACSLIDVSDEIAASERLQHRATHDTLTGLLNRSAMESELARRLTEPHPNSRVCVLFLDLDGFKDINDAYGHQVGDLLLSTIAARLQAGVRCEDALGRLGGDEFLVITSGDREGIAAGQLAERLLAELTQPVPVGPSELCPRVSIGIAVESTANVTSERLLGDADLAMYEAKVGGKDVSFATARTRDLVNLRVGIERDLKAAMEHDEVGFHMQVIRLLDSFEPLGAEALVRWTHPTLGEIPAPQLIERVEATGSIGAFTTWGLDKVCGQLASLRSRVPAFADKGFGINATIRQLGMPGYIDLHMATIERFGLRAQDIIVEVTEYEAVGRGGAAEAALGELAALGVPLALDDFGVGYTALDYLTRLPVAVIKVDRSLVSNIDERPQAQVLLQGLVAMADDLGFETLAEGIETPTELAVCQDIGMRAGQGHLLGRPKPLADFETTDALWTPGWSPG